MKPNTLIAVAGLILTLQGAGVAWIISVERRLAAIETAIAIHNAPRLPVQEKASWAKK